MAFYAYARVSTKGQKQTSIDVQLEFLRREAEELGEEFRPFSEKASGKNVEGREVFSHLIKVLKDGDILGVYDLSRFGRNTEEALATARELYSKGVKIHISGEFYNPADPQSELIFSVNSAIASFERKLSHKKSLASISLKRKSGDFTYRPDLFGYDCIRQRGHMTFTINETHAYYIRFMFEEYLKGNSIIKIEDMLKDHHPNGKNFNFNQVSRILQNPIYIGYYPKNAGDYKKWYKMSEEEARNNLIKSNLYPPIVDEETYWAVFRKYWRRPKTLDINYVARTTQNEVSGVYKCPYCGKPASHTITRNKKGIQVNEVYGLRSHRPNCPNKKFKSIRAEIVSYITLASLLITLEYGNEVKEFFKEERALAQQEDGLLKEQIEGAELRKAEAEKQLAQVKKAVLAGIFEMSDFAEEVAKAKGVIKACEEEIVNLSSSLSKRTSMDYLDYTLEINATELRERVISNSGAARREIYLSLVREAYFQDNKIMITWANGKKFIFDYPKQGVREKVPMKFEMYFQGELQEKGEMDYENNKIRFFELEAIDEFSEYAFEEDRKMLERVTSYIAR